MEIVRRARSMKEVCRQARANGRKIGFVPTMGALHEGHLSLVRRVRELTDVIVVSIYVNPKQFGEGEDFVGYPRDLAQDVDLCIAEGVDYVFAPPDEEIYPEGASTFVEVEGLSSLLEGASRPGHFRGVATVVTKLLSVVLPTVAAFGQKDAQQAAVIRRLVRDLMFDVEILVLPTVRDGDGLALSSRNVYLTEDERHVALAIPRALEAARAAADGGERQAEALVAAAREVLAVEPELELDYLVVVDPETFGTVSEIDDECLLVIAARVGGTRLLDNVLLRP
jgi:pantoate--beta-alanine ligase